MKSLHLIHTTDRDDKYHILKINRYKVFEIDDVSFEERFIYKYNEVMSLLKIKVV